VDLSSSGTPTLAGPRLGLQTAVTRPLYSRMPCTVFRPLLEMVWWSVPFYAFPLDRLIPMYSQIYRCYMVWRSIWVIVFPVIMWMAVCSEWISLLPGASLKSLRIGTAIGCVYTLSQPAADSSDIFVQRTGQWITSFYATTLACNLLATGTPSPILLAPLTDFSALLAYKLWTIDRNVHGSRMGRGLTKPVLMVIIDAGALYSVTLLAALVCFVSKSNGQYVVLDMVTPIISIAFYMVILRIGIAQNTPAHSSNFSSAHQRTPVPRTETSNRLKPMHVHIQQLTEVDHASYKATEAQSHQISPV
jgi:hypothetical protein